MSLIVALAISALSLSVRATYENTHNNTGNQASDIVGIASTQVGYGEGGDGYTKYGDWYGLPYSDWCAMFVSWCANQAGVSTDTFPSFALCSAGADWFMSQGRFHYAGDYQPQAGDLIFYSSWGNIYHVGLVTGSDDYNVYSIEGNYNEAVYNVSYPLSYGDILGYASPNYSKTAVTTTVAKPEPQPEPEQDEPAYVSENEETTDSEEPVRFDDEDDSETETVVSETASETVSEEPDDTDPEEAATDSEKPESKPERTVKTVAGDVNGDGVVNSADALLIQRYLAGNLDEDTENFIFLNADADASGEIDIADALMVLEMSVA